MEGAALAPHDFSITPSYYLFMENQMNMDLVPYVTGLKGPAQTLTMKLDVPVRLHVVPRPGGAAAARGESPRVLDCPPWFCIHVRAKGKGWAVRLRRRPGAVSMDQPHQPFPPF